MGLNNGNDLTKFTDKLSWEGKKYLIKIIQFLKGGFYRVELVTLAVPTDHGNYCLFAF